MSIINNTSVCLCYAKHNIRNVLRARMRIVKPFLRSRKKPTALRRNERASATRSLEFSHTRIGKFTW